MIIALVAAALAEPTSAHLSDRRSLCGHGTMPDPGRRYHVLYPVISASWPSSVYLKSHPAHLLRHQTPVIPDMKPTGYNSKSTT
jgi:hypothetical protein